MLAGKPVELPEGCLLDVELAAMDMLKEFLPKGRHAAIEGYRAIRDDLVVNGDGVQAGLSRASYQSVMRLLHGESETQSRQHPRNTFVQAV